METGMAGFNIRGGIFALPVREAQVIQPVRAGLAAGQACCTLFVSTINSGGVIMNKFIYLLLSVAVTTSVAACGSAPVESGHADAQRSRAEKAQDELGAEVSRQKAESEKHQD